MTVAIGSVLLVLASILLGAVLLTAAFGIILWLSRQQRRTGYEWVGRIWESDSTQMAVGDGTSIATPGK
jgi:hypothetical protein